MVRVTRQVPEKVTKPRSKPSSKPSSKPKSPAQKSQKSPKVAEQSQPKKRASTTESKKPDSTAALTSDSSDFASLPILAGEDAGTVPVFDSCSDIRRKINAHLRKPGVTQAALCRALSACQGSRPDKNPSTDHGGPVQSVQLQKFLRKQGPMAGNTSKVFYTAYVYFEKLRLKEKKEKSKKRLEMEEMWAQKGGVDTKRVSENVRLIMKADSAGWGFDQYGKIQPVGSVF